MKFILGIVASKTGVPVWEGARSWGEIVKAGDGLQEKVPDPGRQSLLELK